MFLKEKGCSEIDWFFIKQVEAFDLVKKLKHLYLTLKSSFHYILFNIDQKPVSNIIARLLTTKFPYNLRVNEFSFSFKRFKKQNMDIFIIFRLIMVFNVFWTIDTFLCSSKLIIKQILCICKVLATVFMQGEDFLNFG